MRWSIRYRLILPLGLLLLSVILVSTWSAIAAAERAEQRIADQVRSVSQSLSTANYPLTEAIIDQLTQLSGAEYLLMGPGERIGTLAELAKFKSPNDVVDPSSEDIPFDQLGPRILIGNQYFRCRRITLKPPHLNAGSTLFIFYPETLLNDAIWDAVRPSIFGLLLGLGTVVLTFGIGQRLVSRIRELERRTRLIALGDFSPMPLPKQNDELRDLSLSVNEMAQRLAKLQETVLKTERLRLVGQLASGLAHQLRNGVAGARLAVQVHESECDTDPESLQVVLRQLSLMEANLRRFIDLGRGEEHPRQRCSLTQILQDVLSLVQPQCKHAGIDLQVSSLSEGITVDGDRAQLSDLFLNLIGNAIEAAGPGGRIEIDLQVDGKGSITIDICDSGPGPSPEIATRLFEPFVTTKPEGIGLGLAVVKRAVEAHHGKIDWRRDCNRTCFRIELPHADRSKNSSH
jgi:signal transduction histidine kinase